MSEYADIQPRHGDIIIHCGHIDDDNRKEPGIHWWKGRFTFGNNVGDRGEAQWLICCDKCYEKAGGEPLKIQVRGHGSWKGNEPIIKKEVVH